MKPSVEEFYDEHAKALNLFALAFRDAISFSYQLCGNLEGKKLLEIGGGTGEQAAYFASQKALVTIIDISKESLSAAQHLFQRRGVSAQWQQMDAEHLSFDDASFDVIYINSVLMHVNAERVVKECSRILKRDGKLVIIEPLRYAPFVQLYRLFSPYWKMNPQYATLKMFKEWKKYFSTYHHKEFYFFSSLFLPIFYFKSALLQRCYSFISKGDALLIRAFPFLRKGCWVSVIEYRK